MCSRGTLLPNSILRGDLALRTAIAALFAIVLLVSTGGTTLAQSQGSSGGGSSGTSSSDGGDGGGGGEPSRWYFKSEPFNEGLGKLPRGIDRDTPQGALESFLFFFDDPDALAHMLDLSDIPVDSQAEVGPLIASELFEVMDRKVWLDWASIPDRPDGLNPAASSDNPLAGEPRRSLRLALLDMEERPVPIRLVRIKPGDAEPVWVFAAQTVENVPELHDLYGPTAFERALPSSFKREAFAGLDWWEVIALPIVLVAAFLAGLLVYRACKAISERTKRNVVGDISHGIATPLAIVTAAAVGSIVTSRLFTFSAGIDAFIEPAITVLVIFAILLIVVQVIDLLLDYALTDDVSELEKPQNDDRRHFQTNLSAARRIGLVILFIGAVGLIMLELNILGGTGIALLGSAGILTLVLAFAGREALSSIMSSLQIAMAKTARVGDAVMWQGQWAYVEKINFTYVQLKSWDQRRLIVPVSEFTSQTFENWTKRDPSLIKVVELRLNHMADVDKLRERFQDWVATRDDIETPEDCKVLVIGHDASGMLVRFYADAKDPSTAWEMHCALREAMLKAAAELDPAGDPGRVYLPAEREAKIADFTQAAE